MMKLRLNPLRTSCRATSSFDAVRDLEAILSLFVDDAVVIDEGHEWRGSNEIRRWRLGPASKYEYTTTVENVDHAG